MRNKKKDRGPINHHTVLQVSLSFFSPDKVHVYRLDKKTGNKQFLPLSQVAKQRHYYSFIEEDGRKNTWVETGFTAPIDAKYKDLVEKLESRVSLSSIKHQIVEQFSTQYARVEMQRENIDRIINQLGIGDEDGRQSLIGMFSVLGVHSGVMHNSNFWIGIASGGVRFLTSDNPVGRGFFPLTPTLCIVSSEKNDGIEYVELTDVAVKKFNAITVDNAKSYIYSIE